MNEYTDKFGGIRGHYEASGSNLEVIRASGASLWKTTDYKRSEQLAEQMFSKNQIWISSPSIS